MKIRAWIGLCLTITTLLSGTARGAQPDTVEADRAALLRDVTEIGAPGSPGSVVAAGERAFAVVLGGSGKDLREPVVAAGRWGRGRVVIFGHTGYLDPAAQPAGSGQLLLNAVRWGAASKRANAQPRVAVRGNNSLIAFLQAHNIDATALSGAAWSQQLKNFDVLCSNTGSWSQGEGAAVSQWIQGGGALLAAETGWGWLQEHAGQTLPDHPGNRMLAPAGLAWSDGFLNRTSDKGFKVEAAPSPLTQAARALEALLAQEKGAAISAADAAQAVWSVTRAVPSLSPADPWLLPSLRRVQTERREVIIPREKQPITPAQPLARLMLTLQVMDAQRAAPAQIKAHPAAADFPGAVPAEAPRLSRTIAVDTKVPAWHSTGLYAAPGEIITIEAPAEVIGARLQVRIGAHRDTLWGLDSWKRAPDITRVFPLNARAVTAANAFGGPIYIEVPEGCKLGEISLTLRSAVEAPYFKLGRTTLDEWRASIRQRPAPWAELEGRTVILTLPSEVVRDLGDPAALMQLWDEGMDAVADLATIPRERARPERYVADRQISAGYMHSGYPIMTHLDVAPNYVDKAAMIEGKRPSWGFWHEVGHNHQVGDWTFGGTGEVTNNLFALYVIEKVLGPRAEKHPAMTPEARAKRLSDYLAKGASFEKWKSDPFLALTMYVQLQEAFGWDAYKKVFAEYRALKLEERPQSDDEKRDQWLMRFSRAVGRNLGPFFTAWGVPTSTEARASIGDLPAWMPPDFPAAR